MRAAIAIALTCGCSWITMTPPRRHVDPEQRVTCDSAYVVPVVDSIAAIGLGVVTGLFLVGVAAEDGLDSPQRGRLLAIDAAFAAGGVAFAWSARTGFTNAHDCRALAASRR